MYNGKLIIKSTELIKIKNKIIMKKIIFIGLLKMFFQQVFSLAVVCYQRSGLPDDCFWTNYKCSDFTNCTQNCTCVDLSIATSNDPNEGVFEFSTEGTTLRIRKQGSTTWTGLVNLSSIMNVDTQVFKVTMNCAMSRVTISIYNASTCINSGSGDTNACFDSTRNIRYTCP